MSASSSAAAAATGGNTKSTSQSQGTMSSRAALLRLASDLRHMQEDPPAGVSAAPVSDSNMFQWHATIVGPDETPWEGGIFDMRLTFPDEYPVKAPKVRFTSEMFHPNVYPDGTLCLDIIQDKWNPIYTVSTILASVQSLLTDPNNDSPANVEAAKMFKSNPKEYKRRVRRIAQRSVEGD